jgi:hypothetical protein
MVNVDRTQIQKFYVAAVLGLRVLEKRDPGRRRFGPDADARWHLFRGELGDGGRLAKDNRGRCAICSVSRPALCPNWRIGPDYAT